MADNTAKQNNRDVATSDDKFNRNKTNSKIQNDKHLCPECKSHSLRFKTLSINEGKQIQLIICKTCGFEWEEIWTLPNWFWLKSSSPDNHWTSERWNIDYCPQDRTRNSSSDDSSIISQIRIIYPYYLPIPSIHFIDVISFDFCVLTWR